MSEKKMTGLLMKLCLPRGKDPEDPQLRQCCGALSGWVGIGMNVLLFLAKLGAGLATRSMAMLADGVNNLSDAATSVVTLIGFRLAGMEADENHPFGHGRIEYITGLAVAFAILLMGLELGRSAIMHIIRPSAVDFSWAAVAILAVAILAKLWLYLFNRRLGQLIGSAALEATAADSLSDTLSTGVVLVSTLVGHFTAMRIDGVAGLIVAVLILRAGWEAAKETIDPLLGRPMDADLAHTIDELVAQEPDILGIHDMIYHDYGPGRAMMSFHAEVPAEKDILELHDAVDKLEHTLGRQYHIRTVIHMDPVLTDQRTIAMREQMAGLVRDIDPSITIHDFRVTPGTCQNTLMFGMVVPYHFRLTDLQVRQEVRDRAMALDPTYYTVTMVERSFVSRDRD